MFLVIYCFIYKYLKCLAAADANGKWQLFSPYARLLLSIYSTDITICHNALHLVTSFPTKRKSSSTTSLTRLTEKSLAPRNYKYNNLMIFYPVVLSQCSTPGYISLPPAPQKKTELCLRIAVMLLVATQLGTVPHID